MQKINKAVELKDRSNKNKHALTRLGSFPLPSGFYSSSSCYFSPKENAELQHSMRVIYTFD